MFLALIEFVCLIVFVSLFVDLMRAVYKKKQDVNKNQEEDK